MKGGEWSATSSDTDDEWRITNSPRNCKKNNSRRWTGLGIGLPSIPSLNIPDIDDSWLLSVSFAMREGTRRATSTVIKIDDVSCKYSWNYPDDNNNEDSGSKGITSSIISSESVPWSPRSVEKIHPIMSPLFYADPITQAQTSFLLMFHVIKWREIHQIRLFSRQTRFDELTTISPGDAQKGRYKRVEFNIPEKHIRGGATVSFTYQLMEFINRESVGKKVERSLTILGTSINFGDMKFFKTLNTGQGIKMELLLDNRRFLWRANNIQIEGGRIVYTWNSGTWGSDIESSDDTMPMNIADREQQKEEQSDLNEIRIMSSKISKSSTVSRQFVPVLSPRAYKTERSAAKRNNTEIQTIMQRIRYISDDDEYQNHVHRLPYELKKGSNLEITVCNFGHYPVDCFTHIVHWKDLSIHSLHNPRRRRKSAVDTLRGLALMAKKFSRSSGDLISTQVASSSVKGASVVSSIDIPVADGGKATSTSPRTMVNQTICVKGRHRASISVYYATLPSGNLEIEKIDMYIPNYLEALGQTKYMYSEPTTGTDTDEDT